ncbi:leukocyte antigen CD37 isoform X2 [Ascaphus truei]|uniref:leukocyte antigen CD37 isoform X2 n=1 Tax=Ascaphus truei TaxID=8439 RepID=UPI003F5AA4F9
MSPRSYSPSVASCRNRKKMATKGCLSITKYFLIVFNLLFFILGGLLFCFGLWILFDRSGFASMLGASSPTLKVWSYVLSGVGILTMVLGFLGCLGSLKEVKCMLGFYFAFLLLLFATQIILGVLIYIQSNTLKGVLGNKVEGMINSYGIAKKQTDLEEIWDFTQEKMKCCGWSTPDDWMKNDEIKHNTSLSLYPCSCRNTSIVLHYPNSSANFSMDSSSDTKPKSGFCEATTRGKWPVYQTGCMDIIENWLINNIFSIVGLCIGIALLELFVMTLSMCLCRNLDLNYNKLARYS